MPNGEIPSPSPESERPADRFSIIAKKAIERYKELDSPDLSTRKINSEKLVDEILERVIVGRLLSERGGKANDMTNGFYEAQGGISGLYFIGRTDIEILESVDVISAMNDLSKNE